MSKNENKMIELYKQYHQRLIHEYDLSWQQIKVSIYISGVIIGALTLIKKELIDEEINQIIYVVLPITGLLISISSLIIFIGSLKCSKEIRINLKRIEQNIDIDSNFLRYTNFKSTYSKLGIFKVDLITIGKFLLQISIIVFWILILI